MLLFQLLKGNTQNKVSKSNPAPQTALNDEDEESEDEVFAESSKAVWYADNQKLLKRALELWDGLYGQDDSARKAYKDVLDVGVTLEYIQIMAVIFKLMQVVVLLGIAVMFEFILFELFFLVTCLLSTVHLPVSVAVWIVAGSVQWIDFQCDFDVFLCALSYQCRRSSRLGLVQLLYLDNSCVEVACG